MMIQDGEEVPDFRYNALEEQFCIHMEKLLTILTDYGELRKEFKIQRMLNLLKIENWTESVPMEFYLQPFKDAIDEARKEMREMSRRGLNLCRYTMRLNHEMQSLIITMVDHDVTCQWLMGDQLKRDQFCFIYEVVKRLYDSPAREKLLAMDKELCTKSIPRLTVFRTLVHMREIIMEKDTFEKKQKKLKEPCYPVKEGQQPPEPEEEEKQPEPEPEPEVDPAKEEELTPEELFLKREEETREEREQFGRFWIWDRYISEGKRGYWQEMAELMTHINDHVVEDIDDHIKMNIFKIKKQKDLDKYLDIVASMKETDNEDFLYKTMSQKKKRQDREEFKEETEAQFVEENKKRTFCVQLRPPFIWNFFGERDENLKHLIDPGAKPEDCYKYEENN